MTIQLFTIGFAGKTAERFITLLREAGVARVVDTRLYPDTQLSGFARKKDLGYFLQELAGIGYIHREELAPSKALLDANKKKEIGWDAYAAGYNALLHDRQIAARLTPAKMDKACFLCAEPTAQFCHRRLLVEYLKNEWTQHNVKIMHL